MLLACEQLCMGLGEASPLALAACINTECGINSAVERRGLFDKIKNAIKGAADDVGDAFGDAADFVEDTFDDVKDTAKDVVDDVKDTAKDVVDDVKDTAKDVADAVKDAAGDVKGAVKNFYNSAAGKKAREIIVDAARDVTDSVKTFVDTIGSIDFDVDSISDLVKIGLQVEGAVTELADSMKDTAVDVVVDIAKETEVLDLLERLDRQLFAVGKNTLQEQAMRIEAAANIKKLRDSTTDAMDAALAKLFDTAFDVSEDVPSAIQNVLASLGVTLPSNLDFNEVVTVLGDNTQSQEQMKEALVSSGVPAALVQSDTLVTKLSQSVQYQHSSSASMAVSTIAISTMAMAWLN